MIQSNYKIPNQIAEILPKIKEFRPVQKKAIESGIFEKNENFLIVSPTSSGKTLVSEFLLLKKILIDKKKVIYCVPLKALASQIYRDLKKNYEDKMKIQIAIGDNTQSVNFYKNFDILITTQEKFDSLIRGDNNFLNEIGLLIVDEIHLLNDFSRGPTLEIILSLILTKYKKIQILGLSATISNYDELSKWLRAIVIKDDFRPTILEHHIVLENELERYK
jgi:helicase